jgi:carbohydrate kinase (thermoresistant glucokinase family)
MRISGNAKRSRQAGAGRVLVISGVSGSGKSTIGRMLASRLSWRFIEGDEYHPASNVDKMQRGELLNDMDRQPWLQRLREEIQACLDRGERAVLACSALKKRYREQLQPDPDRVCFVFLTGDVKVLRGRLLRRQNHFMNPALLGSQLDALELPRGNLSVDIDQPASRIVEVICDWLGFHKE